MMPRRCSARRRMGLGQRRATIATPSWRCSVGDDWRERRQVITHAPVHRTVSKSTQLLPPHPVSAHLAFDRVSMLLVSTPDDRLWVDAEGTSLPPPDTYAFDEEHMLGECSNTTEWEFSINAYPHRLLYALERRGISLPRRPWGMV